MPIYEMILILMSGERVLTPNMFLQLPGRLSEPRLTCVGVTQLKGILPASEHGRTCHLTDS